MKKLIVILAVLTATTVSAQTKPKTDSVVKDPVFVAVFTRPELAEFVNFLNNADMFSDKGRKVYIDEFMKKITLLPPPADTTKKKK